MKHALSTLDDPIIASVSPTFTMALMVICVFLDRIFTNALLGLTCCGLAQ
ncbi:hypothetical protein JG559_07715 [Enterococcus faecalis]|uniref:Uncharacterized protein n=1 Tax=Enterococcus faecalis TaxID=1351 RepID=A0A974S6D6_ENTFL|nr:hypothetical protein JG559_07715 [Enterococcus faecalis]